MPAIQSIPTQTLSEKQTITLTSTPEIEIQRGDIARGFYSIAEHLGLNPSEIVFVNSLITDPEDSQDFKLTDLTRTDWCSAQYVAPLTVSGTKSITFEAYPEHTAYLRRYVVEGELITVPEDGKEYPGGSIFPHLNKALEDQKNNEELYNLIKGKRILNSYPTNELSNILKKLGHQSFVSTNDFIRFGCKSYVKDVSRKSNFNVPPGIVFREDDSMESYLNQIRHLIQEYPRKKIWIKASSLGGGEGIFVLQDPDDESLTDALVKIARGYQKMRFFKDDFNNSKIVQNRPFKGIEYFMPIIVDVDVESVASIDKVIYNACVQAVVSKEKITLVGTTLQNTKDGGYVDGFLPWDRESPGIQIAEEEALKLLKKMSEDGYIGYAGVDVLVAKNGDDDGLTPFVLEVNTRLNGSTPLLSLIQRAEALTGQRYYGSFVVDAVEATEIAIYMAILAKTPEKLEHFKKRITQSPPQA
eukprot:TRINITY_DN1471_c0_g1_i2.p1 TRINITY_DN1471_c0_g1~~TRINITY_DN1471_c0_g1_i2.p1  ORF type:complete len:471 (-),score=79.12 TRINITY_DN1471_c0_g1_i2:159-1571(-)